ncbi:hypothetical protein [Stenotrophomonas acidaminiphila]
MPLWSPLFPRTPAVFETRLSRREAVASLQAATARGNITATGSVAGTVDATRVHLYHRTPQRNSFKPHFRGQLIDTPRGCELRGRFALPGLVVAFMVFWLGFCVLWTVVTAMPLGSLEPMRLPAALPGVLMAAIGIGLVRLGQHLARDDPAELSRVIRQALQSPTH